MLLNVASFVWDQHVLPYPVGVAFFVFLALFFLRFLRFFALRFLTSQVALSPPVKGFAH